MARRRTTQQPNPEPVEEPIEAQAGEPVMAAEVEPEASGPEVPEPEGPLEAAPEAAPAPAAPSAPAAGVCLEPNGPTPRCIRDMVRGRLSDGTQTHRCERCGLERAR